MVKNEDTKIIIKNHFSFILALKRKKHILLSFSLSYFKAIDYFVFLLTKTDFIKLVDPIYGKQLLLLSENVSCKLMKANKVNVQ